MNDHFLINVLDNLESYAIIHRKKVVNIVLEHPFLIKKMVKNTFNINNVNISSKSALILEFLCSNYGIDHIVPYLDEFTASINQVSFHGTMRSCAKICEHIAKAYTSKGSNIIQQQLTQAHIDVIVETGFDWLIGEHKIAVKAYTMQTLYLFGLQLNWVHPELEHLISTKVIHESKGCKARGRKILELIRKNNFI